MVFAIGDNAHVYFKVACYPGWTGANFFYIPWWVLVEFAFVGILLLSLFPLKEKVFRLTVPIVENHIIGISLTWTLSMYFLSSLISEDYFIIKNIILFGMAIIHSLVFKLNKNAYFFVFLVGFFGCATEAILGKLNIFIYTESASIIPWVGVPWWLFSLYSTVAISAKLLAKRVHV